MDKDELSRIKARLAVPREQAARHATANDYIAAMLAEVAASRENGKTWKQIAEDFKPDVQLSADSLRQAFERRKRGKSKNRRRAKPRRAAKTVKEAPARGVVMVSAGAGTLEQPGVELGVFAVTRDSMVDVEERLL